MTEKGLKELAILNKDIDHCHHKVVELNDRLAGLYEARKQLKQDEEKYFEEIYN